MAGTYSDSVLEVNYPQYAYALAIMSGGAAFLAAQLGEQFAALVTFMLLAAFFASVWPDRAMHWAMWLCLPIVLLICFDFLVTFNIFVILRKGPLFGKALLAASLGAYLGSKLSVRRISRRYATSRRHRSSLKVNGKRARASAPALKAASASSRMIEAGNPSGLFSRPILALPAAETAVHPCAALIKAAEAGDLEGVRRLLAGGAEVDAACEDRWTPLMIAALCGDQSMVETMGSAGAATNSRNGRGWTALMVATAEGHLETVRALIEGGADVKAVDDRGWTALRLAVAMGETEVVRLLLAAGADASVADREGRTALMQASAENSVEIVEALLRAGNVDPNIKDHRGQSALAIARKQGHSRVIRLLKEAGAETAADINAAIKGCDDSYFYLLKEELEEALNPYTHTQPETRDGAALQLLSALQDVEARLDAAKKERSLAPSELAHKLALSLREAAALSGLPRQHLLEAVEEGALKARLVKHSWLIKRADLDDYLRRLS